MYPNLPSRWRDGERTGPNYLYWQFTNWHTNSLCQEAVSRHLDLACGKKQTNLCIHILHRSMAAGGCFCWRQTSALSLCISFLSWWAGKSYTYRGGKKPPNQTHNTETTEKRRTPLPTTTALKSIRWWVPAPRITLMLFQAWKTLAYPSSSNHRRENSLRHPKNTFSSKGRWNWGN